MQCPNCQASLESHSKFCTGCGHKLVVNDEAATATAPAVSNVTNQQYLDQGKQISKQYLTFAKQTLKHPLTYASSLNDANKVNAFISLVLYSFLFTLFLYTFIKNMSIGFFAPSFSEIVVMPTFMSIILMLVVAAILFGVSKLMKAELSFMDVLTRFGALLTIPAAILLVANVLAALSVLSFAMILVFIAGLCYLIAIAATVMSIPTQPGIGIDKFYGMLLTYITIFLVSYMLGESIFSDLIADLNSITSLF